MLMTVAGAILYGTTAELPLFLQTLMGYPALQSGYAMSPRGIAAFVTTFLVGRLVGRVRCAGCCVSASRDAGRVVVHVERHQSAGEPWRVIWPSMLNGVAISFIFVPLTTTTMSQLRQQQIGSATGLYNLMRNLGGSIGIAFVTTMLARGAQAHQALMVGHLTPTDPVFRNGSPPRNTRWPSTPTS
jgi:DHA2 family multidrug resistance protein